MFPTMCEACLISTLQANFIADVFCLPKVHQFLRMCTNNTNIKSNYYSPSLQQQFETMVEVT